ncbi:MAG: response regulator transcription factor [Myxococcales bacterium]|nr:response regulator transcription factor [Myxococcales bacterium]
MESVLIVEDDVNIARGLQKSLQFEGFKVLVAHDGDLGLEMALDGRPDLVLLDVMLPKLNGLEVLRELRRLNLDLPVIMLTAKGEEFDIVRGLDLGADDYMTKPFALSELKARIRAMIRRRKRNGHPEVFAFGEVEVDFAKHVVSVRGDAVPMTAREMALLRLFVDRESEALSREEIVTKVWGFDYEGTDRTLDNFILRLRQKLEADASKPRHFLTVRGVGYRFCKDSCSR